MPQNLSPSMITQRVQQLLSDRKKHADALALIDNALAQISSLLGAKTTPAPAPKLAVTPVRRRKRRKYAMTGRESVFALVKRKGGATTKEIKAHWKAEGRGGSSDNMIGLLVKAKELKRTPLKDQPGSRYTIA